MFPLPDAANEPQLLDSYCFAVIANYIVTLFEVVSQGKGLPKMMTSPQRIYFVLQLHVESIEPHLRNIVPSILPRIRLVALAHPSHVIPTLNTVVSLCDVHAKQTKPKRGGIKTP